MADREQNPAATLGRVISWIGSLWVVFSVLWGLGALQALGISGRITERVGSSVFPAIVLIGVGRVLRKRARAEEDSIRPDVSAPVRTPPILPRSDPRFELHPPIVPTAPKPPPRTVAAPKKVVERPVEVVSGSESGYEKSPTQELQSASKQAGRPKTSQELIEEARQRWGTRP